MSNQVLVVFDFDHTILDDNADTSLFNLIEDNEEARALWDQYEEGKWTEFMNKVVTFVHSKGVSVDNIKNELSKLPLVYGFGDLLHYIKNNPQFDCIIVSDANSLFIETILKARGLLDCVTKIITNPAVVNDNGKIIISPCHSHTHETCPPNMCKGTLLQEFLKNAEQEYFAVCYVGDGTNDLCPCLSLTANDFAFPRRSYSLEKKIDTLPTSGHLLKAKVMKWESGLQLRYYLEEFFHS